MLMVVFCVMTLCYFVGGYQHSSKMLANTIHAASQPRTPWSVTVFFSFERFKCYSLNECLLETSK